MTRPRTHRQTPPLTPLRRAWLIFALTGLGCCVGVLTLLYGAAAYIKLPGLALFRSYFHHPALLGLNLLPPVLLIWLFYFLPRRGWCAFLGSFLPCVAVAMVNYFKIRLRSDPFLAADLTLISEAGGIVGNYSLDVDWLTWLTLGALVVLGGLGFLVWQDIAEKRSWKKLSVYSRLVLLATASLIGTGWFFICLLEWNNPETLGNLSVGSKLLGGLFQSITLRTAGFDAINQAGLTQGGKAVSMVLMLIGGSSGSTAGGLKTVTFLVVLLFIWARARGRSNVSAFCRTIPQEQALNAMTISLMMVLLSVLGGIFVCATSPVSFTDGLFEAISALATVGLTAGATGLLSVPAKILIIIFMYFGRVGVLTISLGFLMGNQAVERFRYAETSLLIG